jgi:hypothetical protein
MRGTEMPQRAVQLSKLGRDGAAKSSPPQSKSDLSDFDHFEWRNRVNPTSRGEGLGVGVARCGTSARYGTTPHPNPPPQGGRECARIAAQSNLGVRALRLLGVLALGTMLAACGHCGDFLSSSMGQIGACRSDQPPQQ